MNGYEVKPATRLDCYKFISDIHYAKRWPSISYAYGLYLNGTLEGVVTFGTPSSAPLRNGLAGEGYARFVIELNRLCLLNNRKNEASFLVSNALKMMKKIGAFIVISFADTNQGHTGIVYQACNFGYYGLSEKRTDWKVRGKEHMHGQTIADEFRGAANRSKQMRDKYGDDFYLEERPRKHRYITVIGSRGFVAQATKAIKYKRSEYPK